MAQAVPRSGVSAKTWKAPIVEVGMDYLKINTIEADKMSGKPCIRGLRITVYDVLDYLASGMTEAEILTDFPDLRADDLRAALALQPTENAGCSLFRREALPRERITIPVQDGLPKDRHKSA